jgi:ectoine hydroxylase-related dioxygenase (phytanoyl-CoA dioxygenase family)
MEVTGAHLEHWREHGYVVLENMLDPDELAAAQEDFRSYYPTFAEYLEAPRRYHWIGNGSIRHFPFDGGALNRAATHPALVSFVEQALGTSDLFLCQAILVAKYSGAGNDEDQPLHLDYDDNSLLYPGEGVLEQVPMILYLTDVTAELSPTYVVSQRLTEDRPLWPTAVPASEDPDFYALEVPVEVPAGSALVHSMRTWHRGSRFTGKGERFAQHLVFRHAQSQWMGWETWGRRGNNDAMIRFLSEATPRERELVGVPPAGHEYWTEETIRGVARRYPHMDMTPYLQALHATA